MLHIRLLRANKSMLLTYLLTHLLIVLSNFRVVVGPMVYHSLDDYHSVVDEPVTMLLTSTRVASLQ